MKHSRMTGLLALFLVTGMLQLLAQTESPGPMRAPNTIYGELGGKGLLYGFFYERLVDPHFGVSLGFSTWNVSFFSSTTATIVPFFVSWYSGGSESHLYVDAGADYVSLSLEINPLGTFKGSGVVPFAGAGYCFRSSSGGIYFRIGPMAFIAPGQVQMWGNLSLGAAF